jgi:hypothetical protein
MLYRGGAAATPQPISTGDAGEKSLGAARQDLETSR